MPGGHGTIKIKFRTSGYGGRTVTKRIKVTSNDPTRPHETIILKGTVEAFAIVSPKRVRLRGKVGEEIVKTIKIIPQKKYPFNIKSIKTRQKDNIKFSLKKLTNKKKTEYVITIANIKNNAGRYYDTLLVETDNKIKPEIQIGVSGRIVDGEKKK